MLAIQQYAATQAHARSLCLRTHTHTRAHTHMHARNCTHLVVPNASAAVVLGQRPRHGRGGAGGGDDGRHHGAARQRGGSGCDQALTPVAGALLRVRMHPICPHQPPHLSFRCWLRCRGAPGFQAREDVAVSLGAAAGRRGGTQLLGTRRCGQGSADGEEKGGGRWRMEEPRGREAGTPELMRRAPQALRRAGFSFQCLTTDAWHRRNARGESARAAAAHGGSGCVQRTTRHASPTKSGTGSDLGIRRRESPLSLLDVPS